MSPVRPFPARAERGSALLAALCFAVVLGIALGSYITVCHRTLAMSSRALDSGRSIELAETGMEEALWALNRNDWTGWTLSGSTASKTLSGFDFGGGVGGDAVITVASYDGSAGPRTVTVAGRTTAADGTQQVRTVTAGAAPAPLFVNAAAGTTGRVRFTAAGTSSVIDSYDSSLGLYTAQSPGFSAILSSGSKSTSATVQLTQAQVKGYVATLGTGPSYGNNARLLGPSTPAGTKIDTSRISTSPYQPIFDIRPVTGTGTVLANPPLNSTTTLGTPGASTPDLYYSSGLDLRGTTRIVIDGPVVLDVNGSFYIGAYGGTPAIEITANGSLEVVVSGDIAIYGGGINNLTRAPERVAILGTATISAPDMNTTVPFFGVIYLPGSDFRVYSNNAIHGAIVARNLTFSGSAPVLHYDLALRTKVFRQIETPFAISDWREVTNGN